MILGLAAPTNGRALVLDHPYAELPRAALRIGTAKPAIMPNAAEDAAELSHM